MIVTFVHQMDEFVFDVEDDEEEEPTRGDDLDATIAAVEPSRAEKRREKNRRHNLKRREKARERIVAQEMAIQAGVKTPHDVNEENLRRWAEGMATREKGRMMAEVRKEVDAKVDEWKKKVENGEISMQRKLPAAEEEERKRKQAAHVARNRANRQKLRRQRNSVWGRIGRSAVFGDEPASFLAIRSPGERVWPPAELTGPPAESTWSPAEDVGRQRE